jgi:RNA polymerase sigma-70 factor (ECF subfamily)
MEAVRPEPSRVDARPVERPTFEQVYDAWFDAVERWLRALGAPESELEDWAQEVFLVVRRKLPAFDGAHLPAWLYRICAHTASDHRRRSWFRRLFSRARDVELEALPGAGGPAELLEQKQDRQTLWRLLQRLPESRRVPLVLFELEGYSGEEIAQLLELPVGTVWRRLHQARRELLALVAALPGEER